MNETSVIRIKQATQTDAATVHGMIVQLAESTPAAISLRSTVADFEAALSGDNPAFHALLAECDGHPLGVVVVFLTYSTWYGEPGVYVQDIFVDESFRGTGLGHKLLAAAVQWGAARDATHMKLAVDLNNVAAQAFYEHNGMSPRDDEKLYMIKGEGFQKLLADA